MDEHNNDEVQNDHQDGDQNQSDEGQNHSEQNQNESESEFEQQPSDSEHHLNGAEQNRKASELEQNDHSEHYRSAPNCSEQHSDVTITVREAARIFENAGVPRTERAITKWCNQNARGIARLDCCYNEPERKYYITTQSIDRVIREERHKFQYTEYRSGSILSAAAEDLSEQIRTERQNDAEDEQKASERGRNEAERIPQEPEQVRNEPKKAFGTGAREGRLRPVGCGRIECGVKR